MNNDEIPKYPLYGYNNAEELDRDVEYMKAIYPPAVRSIQNMVDDELDKLEYEGSMMFDLIPDAVALGRLTDKIYDRMPKDAYGPIQTENLQANNRPYTPPYRAPRRDFDSNDNPDWIRHLISSLLFNEMIHRRRRYRSRKQWF